MFNLEKSRLEAARKLVRHFADLLQADLSVELWNGEVLPLGPGARDDIRFVVRSPRAIRRLLLHPGLMTIFELYAEGEFEITGGSPLDASRRVDHPRTRRLAKLADRKLIAKCAVPFLFMGKKSSDNAAYDKSIDRLYARGRDDKELIQFHYDVSLRFTGCFSIPKWSIPALTSRRRKPVLNKRKSPSSTASARSCGWHRATACSILAAAGVA